MDVDPKDLKELLPVFHACRVLRVKLADLEIVFQSAEAEPVSTSSTLTVPAGPLSPKSELAPAVAPAPPEDLPAGVKAPPPEAPLLPQGLEAEMDPDKVLFYSAPAIDMGSVPLTDDAPLVDPAVLAEARPNG